MRRATRGLLWGLAFVFAFVLIYRKMHIVMLVHVAFWQLALLFLGLAFAIYLIMEVLADKLQRR